MSAEVIKISIAVVGVVAVAAGGLYLGWRYRQQIRQEVSSWLIKRNLQNTALMSALLVFDKVVAGVDRVSRKIVVQTSQTGKQVISKEDISLEELRKTDPDVYKQLLMAKDSVEKDIYKLVS
jgi:hypothetical protein